MESVFCGQPVTSGHPVVPHSDCLIHCTSNRGKFLETKSTSKYREGLRKQHKVKQTYNEGKFSIKKLSKLVKVGDKVFCNKTCITLNMAGQTVATDLKFIALCEWLIKNYLNVSKKKPPNLLW